MTTIQPTSNASAASTANANSAQSASQTDAAQNGASGGAADASAKLSGDYNKFLTLLTAQMKHQDPTKPMDATQFVAQLAQFSQVEQAVAMNKKLDQVLTGMGMSQMATAMGFIGRTVESTGGALTVPETGSTSFRYEVKGEASTATALVKDKDGKLVARMTVPHKEGMQSFTWDGMGADGKRVAAGGYSLTVEYSKPSDKQAAQATTFTTAKVTGAEPSDAGPVLLLGGGNRVKMQDVTSFS